MSFAHAGRFYPQIPGTGSQYPERRVTGLVPAPMALCRQALRSWAPACWLLGPDRREVPWGPWCPWMGRHSRLVAAWSHGQTSLPVCCRRRRSRARSPFSMTMSYRTLLWVGKALCPVRSGLAVHTRSLLQGHTAENFSSLEAQHSPKGPHTSQQHPSSENGRY